MSRTLVSASLLMFLIWGSACTTPQDPTPIPPPVSPDIKAELDTIKKAKLEAARYEVQLYEEQLKATKEEIRSLEERAGTVIKTGVILKGPPDSLLSKRDGLEEKVIQAKVKVRELELLANVKQ
jgi:hypothetical protein